MKSEYRAPWVIAYQNGEHRFLKDGAVVVEGDTIVGVGRPGEFPSDRTVETQSIIAPGFISMHTHMDESPVDKGVAEDVEKRQFWSSNLIEILPNRGASLDGGDRRLATKVSIAEHLRTGATTVMHMGVDGYEVAALCKEVGLRAYIAEHYRSGMWFTPDGKRVDYKWYEDDGFGRFEQALNFAVEHKNHDRSDLVTGFLTPSQIDTCSEDLLHASNQAASEHGLMMQIHAAQSYAEFHEMTRRHGRTPIEWMSDLGLLGSNTVVGHGLFVTGMSWTNFPGDDLGLLAESDATVAYNPWVFARNGIAMETFHSYGEHGVRVCLGTDTTPQSMLHSARWASIITKILERRSDVASASDVFNAATVRAADALGRPDLGRLETGAKADMVFWKTSSGYMSPLRDPVRNIVFYAESEDIERVVVNGVERYDGETITGLDVDADLKELQLSGEKVWRNWGVHDYADRTVDEQVPMSFSEFVSP